MSKFFGIPEIKLTRRKMITKELVKAEVEKVQSGYLEVLYKIVKIFSAPPKADNGKVG